MHCYRDGSCFYYCESTFNIVIFYLLLNRCKFTLNCYFCFLAFLFRFLILSCAFEHFMEFAHYKCFIIIIKKHTHYSLDIVRAVSNKNIAKI